MKLEDHEIYEIEKYLLEQDLISLDFYNEMLDHFINAIIDLKAQEYSFDESFSITKGSFSEERFNANLGFSRFRGVKALEMRHYNKLYKGIKDKRAWAPISLLTSKEGLLWLVGFVVYCFLGLKIGWTWAFGLTILVALLLGISLLSISYKAGLLHFNRWYRFMVPSLAERKKVQLKPNYRLFLILDSFKATFFVMPWLFIFLGPFGNDSIIYNYRMYILLVLINMLKAIIGYILIIYMADFWREFKLAYQKTHISN